MTSTSDLPSASARAPSTGRIPVTVLTGFLGAGKTTLLNRLMRQPQAAGIAILVNEFGEIGVDHHLVGSIDEGIVLLDSGCVCCSVNGELVVALRRLFERAAKGEIPAPTRVVIETTGLADPVPVVRTLMEEAFVAARYVCDGVLTMVDATHVCAQLLEHPEARSQIAAADRLVLGKCDLASTAARAAARAQLQALNPAAEVVEIGRAQPAPDLLRCGGVYSSAAAGHCRDWLRADDAPVPGGRLAGPGSASRRVGTARADVHDGRTRSFVVVFDRPAPWYGFCAAMGRLLQQYGRGMLRIKGLMSIAGTSSPLVVHCVRQTAYPVVALERWPRDASFGDQRGRLVFIVRGQAQGMNPDPGADADTVERAVRSALSALPGDRTAARLLAESPLLPTRCWYRQPVAGVAPHIDHEGWVIQRKRLGRPMH